MTAYAHDVDVDATGVAWVSGLGGMRGYWTDGVHHDPLTGAVRRATPLEPIPYAGGGLRRRCRQRRATRAAGCTTACGPPAPTSSDGPALGQGYKPGELVMGTEEWFNSTTCDGEGQFVISSLEGSYNGEGWKLDAGEAVPPQDGRHLEPKDKEATIPLEQLLGALLRPRQRPDRVRLVRPGHAHPRHQRPDESDPGRLLPARTAATCGRPTGTATTSIVADNARGIDVLKFNAAGKKASKDRKEVVAPKMSEAQQGFLANLDRKLAPDAELGWLCPLPVD